MPERCSRWREPAQAHGCKGSAHRDGNPPGGLPAVPLRTTADKWQAGGSRGRKGHRRMGCVFYLVQVARYVESVTGWRMPLYGARRGATA